MSPWNELNAGGRCFCYLAFAICLDLENKTFRGPFWAPQLIPQPSSKGEERENVRESWGEQQGHSAEKGTSKSSLNIYWAEFAALSCGRALPQSPPWDMARCKGNVEELAAESYPQLLGGEGDASRVHSPREWEPTLES